jgi:TorA maturation chaperone TorD
MGERLDEPLERLRELSTALEALAALYLNEPDREGVEFVLEADPSQDALLEESPRALAGFRTMQDFCSGARDEQALLRELTGDQSQLFVGPLKLAAPPWGSVYMDSGSLFGPSTSEVRERFRQIGLQVPDVGQDPEDHIGFELSFLSAVNQRVAGAAANGKNAEALRLGAMGWDFIERLMEPWMGPFFDKVETNAKTGFYRGLAQLTGGLIEVEKGALENFRAVSLNGSDEIE